MVTNQMPFGNPPVHSEVVLQQFRAYFVEKVQADINLPGPDQSLVDLCFRLLELEVQERFSAEQALDHPWMR